LSVRDTLKKYLYESIGCELRGDDIIVFRQDIDREVRLVEAAAKKAA
jgi:hypothetical protein